MSNKRILVINPNSNESVTAGLRASLRHISAPAEVDFCTLEDGPFGIESDDDILSVIPSIRRKVSASLQYDAFVIACYSDPGLQECRAAFNKPIFGMQESAVKEAVSLGGEFGVLALSDDSIRRHLSYLRELGFENQLAAELPLNITVDGAANSKATVEKVIATGRRLIDEYGARSVILGCAGMAAIKGVVETTLPVPVIEPAQAAIRQALAGGLAFPKRS